MEHREPGVTTPARSRRASSLSRTGWHRPFSERRTGDGEKGRQYGGRPKRLSLSTKDPPATRSVTRRIRRARVAPVSGARPGPREAWPGDPPGHFRDTASLVTPASQHTEPGAQQGAPGTQQESSQQGEPGTQHAAPGAQQLSAAVRVAAVGASRHGEPGKQQPAPGAQQDTFAARQQARCGSQQSAPGAQHPAARGLGAPAETNPVIASPVTATSPTNSLVNIGLLRWIEIENVLWTPAGHAGTSRRPAAGVNVRTREARRSRHAQRARSGGV